MKRNCDHCGNEYEAEARYLNRGQGRFCSKECSAFANRGKRERAPNVQCAYCSKEFYKAASTLRSKSGLYYCCKEHQDLGAASKLHRTGPVSTSKRPKRTKRACPICNVCRIAKKTL